MGNFGECEPVRGDRGRPVAGVQCQEAGQVERIWATEIGVPQPIEFLIRFCPNILGYAVTDTLNPQQRSERMSRIRHKDTKPEMRVRRRVHGMGYRYRLHAKDVPGKPDLVFRSRKKVIFVHGCFWHGHAGCKLNRLPKSRQEFWKAKLDANKRRDERVFRELNAEGWRVLVIWECELKDEEEVVSRIQKFLEGR